MVIIKKKYCDGKIRLRRSVLAALRSRSKSVSASQQICAHESVLNGTCVACKKAVDNSHGFSFDYLLERSRSSGSAVSRLKERYNRALLRKRKLVLVLDLDHTLLHSCMLENLTSEEKYLKEKVDSLEDVHNGSLFGLTNSSFLVKLRPFVRNFLEEASNMFEMYVCTMGSRGYAEEVTKLLDPDSKYFNSRIIACEDFKNIGRKDLNLILGQKSNTIILDDTECVWSDHAENLITVGRYEYFKIWEDVESYSEENSDESESNGALANILRVLKTVHGLFFDNPARGGVPSYLAKIRGGILTGCTLLVSEVQDFPFIRSRAELMGATCTRVTDSSITHVVSLNSETEDCRWAEEEKKYLVHPQWIEAAYFYWHRQPEEYYLP